MAESSIWNIAHNDKVGKNGQVVSPCTSHAREAIPRLAVREALFAPCCVGVPVNANDGADVAGEAGSCVPTLLVRLVLSHRARRDLQEQ